MMQGRCDKNVFNWMRATLIAIVFSQLTIIVLCLLGRTDQALASPWQVLPATIFGLFGISVFLLLYIGDQLSYGWQVCLWMAQYFIAFSVSVLVYKLGFGFDPFIHEAATRYLVAHGSIHLPSFLYIGQYVFEAVFSRVTTLSVVAIDRWLVPLLAVFVCVFVLPRLSKLWKLPAHPGFAWPLLLLTFAGLTFTVPYQVTLVLFLVLIIALPMFRIGRELGIAMLLLAIMGSFHPLLMIPGSALVGARVFIKNHFLAGILAFMLTLIGLWGAFWVYVHLMGGTMVFVGLSSIWQALTAVFGFPYDTQYWAWYAKLFYGFLHVWPLLFCFVGWVGFVRVDESVRPLRYIYMGTALGMLVASVVIAATTRFINIISSEQYEFSLRLRYAVPLLFLPGWFIGISVWLRERTERVRVVLTLVAAVFMTVIWHASYPQFNHFLHVSAVGLSATDLHVVQTIERLSEGRSYAALTPQMISAGALSVFGFERALSGSSTQSYPYAIPTGGAFYQQYLRLWHEPDVQVVIDYARAITHEHQIFVALPVNWDPSGVLLVRLRLIADQYEFVDDAVHVFRMR